MIRYLLGRAVRGIIVVYVVASLTFVLLHVSPGDPFSLAGDTAGTAPPPEVVEANRARFGLDRPLALQYVIYLKNLSTGYFGVSFTRQGQPVLPILLEAMGRTVILGLAALIVNFSMGVALGAFQALRYQSRSDRLLSVVTLTVHGLPVFWLGLVVSYVLAERLGWFPTFGSWDPVTYPYLGSIGQLGQRLHHLFLPAVTLGVVGAAATARYQRAAMLDAATLEHVRAARARGLSGIRVAVLHITRNALLPTLTIFGLALPLLLSGSVFVERVFGWNGLGMLTVEGILRRDYQLVTGSAIFVAAMVVAANLLTDALYHIADPRTRAHP